MKCFLVSFQMTFAGATFPDDLSEIFAGVFGDGEDGEASTLTEVTTGLLHRVLPHLRLDIEWHECMLRFLAILFMKVCKRDYPLP